MSLTLGVLPSLLCKNLKLAKWAKSPPWTHPDAPLISGPSSESMRLLTAHLSRWDKIKSMTKVPLSDNNFEFGFVSVPLPWWLLWALHAPLVCNKLQVKENGWIWSCQLQFRLVKKLEKEIKSYLHIDGYWFCGALEFIKHLPPMYLIYIIKNTNTIQTAV